MDLRIELSSTDIPVAGGDSVLAILGPAELATLSSLAADAHRKEYIATRWLERQALSTYLGVPSSSLHLSRTTKGKPYVSSEHGYTVHYSLSNDLDVVYCLCASVPVGVDTERLSRAMDLRKLAGTFLSKAELGRIDDDSMRDQKLVHYWCAKEAAVKALGDGLDRDFATIECKWLSDTTFIIEAEGLCGLITTSTLATVALVAQAPPHNALPSLESARSSLFANIPS